MEDVAYRTSFVLCSLPLLAVLAQPLDINLRYSSLGLTLATIVWVVLLHRIGRGGTPAGASGREVALLRPPPDRLVGMVLADNASRILLCVVVGISMFGRNWPLALALYLATRLVGYRTVGALAAVTLLGCTALLTTGTARTVATVAVVVLAAAFLGSVFRARYELRALASGSDGSDARVMLQFGDWHGLVSRFVGLPWLPTWLAWALLGAVMAASARFLHAPSRLIVPILAFAAAHVSCRTLYDALGQRDRRRLVTRAAGGAGPVIVRAFAWSLPLAGLAAALAILLHDGPTLPAAVVVAWLFVLVEAVHGGIDVESVPQVLGFDFTLRMMIGVRSFAVLAAIAIAYVPRGPWSVGVATTAVSVAAMLLGISTVGAIRARP